MQEALEALESSQCLAADGNLAGESPFARCREKDDYQKILAVLLADVQHRPKVPNVVAIDLLALPDDVSKVYFTCNRAY